MFNLVSTKISSYFLHSCFPSGWPPACPGAWGCSSPMSRTICVPPWTAHFSSLTRSLCESTIINHSVLYHISKLVENSLPCCASYCWRSWVGLDSELTPRLPLFTGLLLDLEDPVFHHHSCHCCCLPSHLLRVPSCLWVWDSSNQFLSCLGEEVIVSSLQAASGLLYAAQQILGDWSCPWGSEPAVIFVQ